MKTQQQQDYAALNEEWIARYRNVLESLQVDDDDDDDNDENNLEDSFVGFSLAARAGRLGSLQCALDDDGENIPSLENLLDRTREEMDRDAATSKQLDLLERLAPPRTNNNNWEQGPIKKIPEEELCADVDVDAFFEEYPECMKSDWEKRSTEQGDSDDDGSDSEGESRPRSSSSKDRKASSEKSHGNVNGNSRPSTSNNNIPQQARPSNDEPQQRPLSSHGRIQPSNPDRSTLPRNPYQKRPSAETSNNSTSRNPYHSEPPPGAFVYTPPTNNDAPAHHQSSSSSSWENHNLVRSGTTNIPQDRRGGYQPPPSNNNPYVSNHHQPHSSWEDHQNKQNPFQTARELAQIMEETPNKSRAVDNHRTNNNSTNGNYGHAAYQNPYSINQPPTNEDEASVARRGGPSIPDSLKRKFQVPKRGATEVRIIVVTWCQVKSVLTRTVISLVALFHKGSYGREKSFRWWRCSGETLQFLGEKIGGRGGTARGTSTPR
jgi:hypothetical protein